MYDHLPLSHSDDYYGLVLLFEHYDIISKDLFTLIDEYFRLSSYVLNSSSPTENEILRFKDDIERLNGDEKFWQLRYSFSMLTSCNATWEKDLDHFKEAYRHHICRDIIEQLKIYVLNLINIWNFINDDFNDIRRYNTYSTWLKKTNSEIKHRINGIHEMYDSLLEKYNAMLDDVLEEDEQTFGRRHLDKIKSATGCDLEIILERDAYRVANGIVDKIFERMKEDKFGEKDSFFYEFVETVKDVDTDYLALSEQDYPRDEETADLEKRIRAHITEVLCENQRSEEDDYVLAWLGRSILYKYNNSLLLKPNFHDIYSGIFRVCWERADAYDLIDDSDYDYYGRDSDEYDEDEEDEENSYDEMN